MAIDQFYSLGYHVWPIMPGNVTTDRPYVIYERRGGCYRLLGFAYWFSEDDLFTTKEEATAACDYRKWKERRDEQTTVY